MGRISLAAAVVAAILLLPATAFAANATIRVGPDKVLSPPSVTINPDETVTWQWAVGSIAHHIVSNSTTGLETWDSGERSSGSFTHPFTHSGSFAYHCAIHPNVMFGTITVTGAPVPAFVDPGQQFVNEPVALSAAGSTDPDGTIAEYRWNFGDGTPVETTTTETTSHTYATAGTFNAKVTVVDDRGSVADATRSVPVFSRTPTASFNATPASVAKGATVALASTSVDHDGTITQFEWDLGNGTFVAGTSTATAGPFTAAGTVTLRLRVTDNGGNVAETTKTVTVTNQAPAAALTASTTSPANGATVSFDASGSHDTDGGTIARYQWDLDGDGTFETDGGTTPTIARAFARAGALTVRVRVTDNEGATGDAT
ncbi:MAG TPA: PKD domain-containing protein, partial [Solirubrobacteraceae bacterium]